MKTRLSRPPAPPANHTLRNFLLGFFGFSLVAACLLLVVGGAILLTRIPPVADQLPLGTAPMLVNLTQPFHNRPVSLTNYNTVHADAIGSNPVLVLQLWVDGVPVDAHNVTAEEAIYSSEFSWQPTAPGEHLLVVRALDSAGQLANSNLVRVQANPAQPLLINIVAEEGDSLQSLADSFDLTPEQVLALNPQITTAADQPLPPGTAVTMPPVSTGPSLGDAEPPIPPDTSLLPVLPDPPTGDVPPAPELDKDNPISIFWDLNITPLWSNTVAPGAPELAVKVNGCDVKLFVFDKAANETGFVVYRASPNEGGFELIAALAANDGQTVMSFTDTGRYGKSLYYVSAFNAAGESPSNFVGTTINSLACLQLDQKSLALDNAKLIAAEPLDKVYCYSSFNGGPWERIPHAKDEFIYPLNGVFDFSNDLNTLVSPPPTEVTTLDMECWGWKGGDLKNLGKAQQLFIPGNGDPVKAPGNGFTLSGIPNFGQLIVPEVLDLQPFILPETTQKIAPPYDFVVATNAETGDLKLLWRWLPVGCPANGDGQVPADCPYITEITGYKVYNGFGVVEGTLGPHQKVLSLPSSAINGVSIQCYQVVAYSNEVESEPSELQCSESLKPPQPALPTKTIPAPYNLRVSADGAECESHIGADFLGFYKKLCKDSAAQKSLVLVWDWLKISCFPSQGDCGTTTDIEGFHIYRAYLNDEVLVATAPQPANTLTILPPLNEPLACYTVRAFNGELESAAAQNVCITFSDYGLTKLKLLPSQGAGYGSAYTQKDCLADKALLFDMPATSFTNPPADFGLNVGYHHTHFDIPCDKTTAVWFEGMVGFDLQQLKGYTVDKAVFLFHTGQVENLSDGGTTLPAGLMDAETASNVDCATGIVVAEGYTSGVFATQSFSQTIEGSMWYGSQQVAPGPFGGYKTQDVTQFVIDALAANNPTLGFIFTTDQSHPERTEVCFSKYDKFSMSVQLSPK